MACRSRGRSSNEFSLPAHLGNGYPVFPTHVTAVNELGTPNPRGCGEPMRCTLDLCNQIWVASPSAVTLRGRKTAGPLPRVTQRKQGQMDTLYPTEVGALAILHTCPGLLPLAVGAAKGFVGHAEASSGMVGLLNVAISLRMRGLAAMHSYARLTHCLRIRRLQRRSPSCYQYKSLS